MSDPNTPSHSSALNLAELWRQGASERRFILWPLIAEGDQVILAGEPKSGKSLLAGQIGLEVASGPRTSQLTIPPSTVGDGADDGSGRGFKVLPTGSDQKPNWRVLYVSFEMRAQTMWARTAQQAHGLKIKLLNPQPDELHTLTKADDEDRTPNIPIFFLFELNGARDLGIFPSGSVRLDRKPLQMRYQQGATDTQQMPDQQVSWRKLVKTLDLDLVIFDSLSLLHFCDENSNSEMRDALQQVRELCTIRSDDGEAIKHIAHIIIHHTRKESAETKFSRKGASEMRGASSIHAEVDTTMTLTKRAANGDKISVGFTNRHGATLPDLLLARNDQSATYEGMAMPEPKKLILFQAMFPIFESGTKMTVMQVRAAYLKISQCGEAKAGKENTWWKHMKELVELGLICSTGAGVRNDEHKFHIGASVDKKLWMSKIGERYGRG